MVIISTKYRDTVHTVDKVTPTGRIKIENIYYNKYSIEMGGGTWRWSSLHEATPEALNEIAKTQTIKKALWLVRNVSDITFEQAVKLIDVLEDKEVK